MCRPRVIAIPTSTSTMPTLNERNTIRLFRMAGRKPRTSSSPLPSISDIGNVACAPRPVHPGIIETELVRHLSPSWLQARVEQINQQLATAGKPPLQRKSVAQGAATSVWAGVVAPADEIGGRYCENCHVAEIVPDEVPT